jgi:hypothetical protein
LNFCKRTVLLYQIYHFVHKSPRNLSIKRRRLRKNPLFGRIRWTTRGCLEIRWTEGSKITFDRAGNPINVGRALG